jgi:hypothetical protein
MASKRRPRVKPAVPLLPIEAPVLVIPKQTRDEIERLRRIREALHDATAVTVKAGRTFDLNRSR